MTFRVLSITLVGALATTIASPIAAQNRGTLAGTITDSVSGAPVVGARVAIYCNDCYGRHPTDSRGHYRLERLPPGRWVIQAHCPSVTGLGAEIRTDTIRIAAGEEAVVDIRVPKGYCDEPAYSERSGVFRGFWTPGFESSAFRPCADSTLGVRVPLLPGKRLFPPTAWADLAFDTKARPIPWPRNAPRDSYGNSTYFVVWRGVLKGPGKYGHMSVSEFSMVVDSIISMRARAPADCRM